MPISSVITDLTKSKLTSIPTSLSILRQTLYAESTILSSSSILLTMHLTTLIFMSACFSLNSISSKNLSFLNFLMTLDTTYGDTLISFATSLRSSSLHNALYAIYCMSS